MNRAVNQRIGLRPLSCGFAWGSYFANFGPAPGWHFWHVASRFAGPTDDRASPAGWISWAVWQSAHVATAAKPSSETWP